MHYRAHPLRRATLVLDTLRRTSGRQVVTRLARRARFRWLYPWLGRWLYPTPAPLPGSPATEGDEPFFGAEPGEEPRKRAEELVARRFSFLNLPPVDLGDPVAWHRAPDGNRLWQYELHYGGWAETLAAAATTNDGRTGEERFRRALLELLADWIDQNPVGRSPGWDPYPTCRRLVSWSEVGLFLDGDGDGRRFFRRVLEPSLRRQARFLARNLEHDVPNNHLLANHRALAWVGLRFPHWPESSVLRRRGLAGLWREMERQLLADGVHAERSVSYHGIVLRDLLETRLLARRRGVEVPPGVDVALRRMLAFLAAARAPGGGWPMVNDSVPGYPPGLAELVDAAARHLGPPPDPRPLALFPDAGYAVLRDRPGDPRGGFLFFDAGPMGPPEVLGHGHADALSIVVHGNGRPLIVDPGAPTYEAGELRDRLRSAARHNTATVDGEEPCTFWGPFRVAHPPPARLLDASEDHVAGEHRGYLRLPHPVVHRRRVDRRPEGWELHDHFEGAGGDRSEHRFALNFQLAPGCRATVDAATDAAAGVPAATATWPDGTRLHLRTLAAPTGVRVEIAEGWVAEGWNLRQSAPRIVLRFTAETPCESRILLMVSTPE